MFDIIITNDAATTDLPDAIAELQNFADEHREALVNASEWLGGPSGSRLALAALDSLCDAYASPRKILRNFGALFDLLMLENVHDPEREEAAIVAGIDPGDPRVEDVCLLADGLAARLDACREAGARQSADDSRRAVA